MGVSYRLSARELLGEWCLLAESQSPTADSLYAGLLSLTPGEVVDLFVPHEDLYPRILFEQIDVYTVVKRFFCSRVAESDATGIDSLLDEKFHGVAAASIGQFPYIAELASRCQRFARGMSSDFNFLRFAVDLLNNSVQASFVILSQFGSKFFEENNSANRRVVSWPHNFLLFRVLPPRISRLARRFSYPSFSPVPCSKRIPRKNSEGENHPAPN